MRMVPSHPVLCFCVFLIPVFNNFNIVRPSRTHLNKQIWVTEHSFTSFVQDKAYKKCYINHKLDKDACWIQCSTGGVILGRGAGPNFMRINLGPAAGWGQVQI